ncbi:short chain dehydrogenase [Opitutaceae bacterium EW11]|nr:short chain dehydrogenase [Opitutaceae bacterium EW11]
MKTAFQSLTDRVVVITGASSGIGRAAARAFAQRGAHVVLAARRERALRKVATECEQLGVRALAVSTDVTDADAVARLAEAAMAAFRRIDVWINNAGVGLFGPFAGADLRTQRRVIETNLFGAMHGAAAVLPIFLEREQGVLITNVSIGGWAPVPFASAYTASKFGLRGFLAGLRQEVAHVKGIHICGVFPSVVDTPGYQHAANVSGAQLRPARPLYSADAVAETFVALAYEPRDEVAVGWPARLARNAYALAPATTERIAGRFFRTYIKNARPAPRAGGNLFLPVSAGAGSSGGWRKGAAPWTSASAVSWALLAIGLGFLGAGVYAQRVSANRRHELEPQPLPDPASSPAY